MKRDQHVVPNPRGGWSVRHTGAARATRVFDTQEEAVKYARDLAQKESVELYVHRRDGTVRESTIKQRNGHGRDAFPLRDK